MISISKTTEDTQGSPIRKIFNLSNKMENVISFALGEPDFTTPQNIIDAECEALKRGETHYTANAGILPLRQAIADKLKNRNDCRYNPENEIMVTSGGMEALMLVMMATLNPGDEVILTDPYWPNYLAQITMCGAVPKFVRVTEEDGFVYQYDSLKKAVSGKTKAIILNSPANPTGGVASLKVLQNIAKIAIDHDLLVISDEVYQNFIYDGEKFISIASLEGMKERTIVVDSFSKTFAMTGWRIGYAAGPVHLIGNMTKLHENVVACVHTPAQYAAIEALNGTQEPLENMIAQYTRRREIIIDSLNKIEKLSCIQPKGAFYVFLNITKTGLTSDEFAIRLLEREHVAVVPGTGFGKEGQGFVRLSYATSEENIREGIRRMEHFVSKP